MKREIIRVIKNSPLEFAYRFLKKLQLQRKDDSLSVEKLKFYSNFLKSGDIVFDVGANYGNRSRVFKKIGCKTIAFEPQTPCYDFLKSYFWGDSQVRIEKVALGGAEGTARMKISKNSVLSTLSEEYIQKNVKSGRFSQDSWEGEEIVRVSTLDFFIKKYGCPKFIKIDVEGFEAEVVRGLTEPVEMLSLEFSTETRVNVIEAIEHLAALCNYRFQFSSEESFAFSFDQPMDLITIKKLLLSFSALEWGDVYCSREWLR
jgi:FkbM family methyltransferase